MNKKVLTLCAGFLLAGGMLSNASAVDLATAANTGKYYKMLRIGQKHGNSEQWQTNTEGFSLEYIDGKICLDNNDANGIDYWRVSGSSAEGYTLTNLTGETLTVKTQSVNENNVAGEEFTNLDQNEWYVIEWENGDTTPYEFIPVTGSEYEAGTNYYSAAFDAQETSLELNTSIFNAVENGKYYYIVNGGEPQYKAVKNSDGTFSFVENTSDGDGDNLSLNGATAFELVEIAGAEGQYLLKVGDSFIAKTSTGYTFVKTEGEATIFSFSEVTSQSLLKVEDLTYYELDGFSLTITYDSDKKSVAGNPFVGHLTPMVYTGRGFVNAPDGERKFFLKNEEGKYIVAKLYGKGATITEDIYTFTTVDEATLLHFLSWANDDKDPAYYGMFSAESKDYYLNKQNLGVLDDLNVYLPTTSRTSVWEDLQPSAIGRYEIAGVWTLAVSAEDITDTALEPVTIAVNGASLVQAKDLLLQKKFFTVVRKGSSNPRDYANGPVAVNEKGVAGVVSSYGNPLEGQWAITYDTKSNVYTLTNRENTDIKFTLNGSDLYTTNADYTYRHDHITNGVWQLTDTLVIAPVPEHAATDGYETLKNLKNVKFNIGYASGVYGNAWFTENHEGVNNHTIGLDTDAENALVFTATEYADAKKRVETPVHGYVYVPSDSIYVVSEIGYINAKNEYDTDKDTLKVVSYSFVNQWNEPLIYAGIKDKYVSSVNEKVSAQKFALRQDGERLNLRPVYLTAEESYSAEDRMYNVFDNNKDLYKMYAGDAANGILDNVTLYDRTENDYFVVEPTDVPMYRPVINPLDTISIYRNDNSRSLLYEKGEFLGMENIADFTDMNPAFLADTAYVRYDTYRPQYMLVVGAVKHDETTYCPDHGIGATCQHADTVPGWVEGRYLVNLKDTAIAWDEANKHKDGNPYINSEKFYKLGFVQAKHIGDSLMIEAVKPTAADTINVGTEDFNVAKFAFRYVDTEAQSFVIETANYKKLNERNAGARDGEGYLKWMNGVVVVVDDIENADVYNMNEDEDRTPTANEAINAEGAISVVATDGAVIIKGAEGKNVVIATILGKVVANETVNSDNETIAVPAGIAVVSVDGESFKVVVK